MGSILEGLFPATRRSLLVGFLRRPRQRFYMREIIRFVGKGQGSVQRELGRLVAAGILTRETDHGRTYFRANQNCPVFPELRSLIEKTAGLVVVLERALGRTTGVLLAFVFGSVARGEERADSDVDLAVVGDARFRDIVAALRPAQQTLGREINPVVYSAVDLRQRLSEGDHFVHDLMSGPKTFVIGSPHDLGALVRE
jgi:predicted nucleotidyltransferase